MKYSIFIPTILATLLTASCAELNTALEAANQALGTLNGTVSGSSTSGSKTVNIPNESTTQFQTRNMKLEIEPSAICEGKYRLLLAGSAYNKTNKDLYLAFNMPTYNAKGERKGAFTGRQLLSPKEWNEYSSNYQDCIEKFDINTLTFKSYTP